MEDGMDDFEGRRRRGLIKIAVGVGMLVVVIIITIVIMPLYYG